MGFLSDLTSGLYDVIGGGSGGANIKVPTAYTSGAFPGLGVLGTDLRDLLIERMKPVTESSQYALGSRAIREAVNAEAGAASQKLGERAVAGGYLDSGAVGSAEREITRGRLQAISTGLRDLILGLESQRGEGALPFLSAGANELQGVESLNINATLARMQHAAVLRGQNLDFASEAMKAALEASMKYGAAAAGGGG